MNNVLYSEFLEKETLLATSLTWSIQAKSENTFAVIAAQVSAIERTRHSTIFERVKIKSDWHWRWPWKEWSFKL